MYKWVNLFTIGKAEGFVYFNAYIDESTNSVVGWVTRTGNQEPYAYNIYYSIGNGKLVSDTRGTWKHALWAVQGAIASLPSKSKAGIFIRNRDIRGTYSMIRDAMGFARPILR